ncbi:nuclear transport factor 2 family protein [Flavobacterium pallidum]|uniref:Nuclear transport factor 2 family protein n=1 Tax=Flavobacterium pallidum TaxID=2172098 RepID=A0A2S1SIB9_9FLAO|nr:nuclear transport factor 2 family protein [Flavobacterium pallidum]AWI26131.1 nuclear transport factor 2 family protein [Flavobacterium pallidum]
MITEDLARSFAANWAAAWNSHNLDTILSHYSDDFIIETPMAAKLLPDNDGIVEGRDNVRAYWQIGLERIPNLHFEIIDVLTGINSLTIYYINTATGRKSAENLFFNEAGKVHRAFVMYS